MSSVTVIDQILLDTATAGARAHPRRRRNRNFHAAETAACNRLLNAIEPGSYVQPHRHLEPSKDETMIVVRGRLGLVLFDDNGRMTGWHVLCAQGPAIGVDIPHGAWHTLLALEPGTIFFEAKAGPYRPLTEEERAPWAPAEGSEEAEAALRSWERHFASAAD
jgi:cupin fold WbuC family metalloprotein